MIPKSTWDKLKREDSEGLRDLILDSCKKNEMWNLVLIMIGVVVITMIGNMLGMEQVGEWLR